MKRNPGTLLLADSTSSADMLYLSGFECGDPFIYLKSGRKSTIVVTDFEVGRAEKESAADEVIPVSSLLANGNQGDIISAAGALLSGRSITHVKVPFQFPAGAAERLTEEGITIEIQQEPFLPERQRKNSYEVKLITQTQRKAERAMETAIRWIQRTSIRRGTLYYSGKPLTAQMVRQRIHLQLMEEGCTASSTIVACGDQGIDPHNTGKGPLKANKPIIIDIFPQSIETHYYADISRTIVKGKATDNVKKMFRAVREGQRIAMTMIKPGVNARKIHEAICEHFESVGFKTGIQGGRRQGFIHGTGHGVGLEVHEPPRISQLDVKLKAGNVVTLEPGLYYKGHGGVRLEDMVLVTTQGARNLTRFAKILEV